MRIKLGKLRSIIREAGMGDPRIDDFIPMIPERASAAFPRAFIEWDEEMGPIDAAKFFVHVEREPILLASLEDGTQAVWDPKGKAWDFM